MENGGVIRATVRAGMVETVDMGVPLLREEEGQVKYLVWS